MTYIPGGSGGGGTIATAGDVALNNISDSDILAYDSKTEKWTNATIAGVGDATSLSKGIVQLAGDLDGTAEVPTVPGLSLKADLDDPRFTDAREPSDSSVTQAKVATGNAPTTGQMLSFDGTGLTWASPQQATGSAWTQLTPADDIQVAINSGSKAIQLSAGEWTITSPIIPTAGCTIRGVGQSTRIRPIVNVTAVFAIGNGGAVDGVCVGDLVVDCNGLGNVGIDINSVGTTGHYQGEPDAVHRIDNLWVYDAITSGMWLRGTDTQATTVTRVRVRRAGTYGFRVEAPDNWIAFCEATTQDTTEGAGFYCAGANNFYEGNKAWYCRNYGWQIRCTRSSFTNNHSQDTRNHGWYVQYDKNTFTGCIADSAAYGGVGGTLNGADGWYFVGPFPSTVVVGCLSFDRAQGYPEQQRYGFNASAIDVTEGRLIGYAGYGNVSGLLNQR